MDDSLIPERDELTPNDMVAVTDAIFRHTAVAAINQFNRINTGDVADVGKAGPVLKDLRVAANNAIEERGRLDKLAKQEAGVVHDYALDLEKARTEILGRLARIRAAGGDQGCA